MNFDFQEQNCDNAPFNAYPSNPSSLNECIEL